MTKHDDHLTQNSSVFDIDRDLLPEVIPFFPLSDVLILPCAKLPLNIFEPRYMDMVDYALGHDRWIGMIQPRTVGDESRNDTPNVYTMGCLGRIVSFSETSDKRYAITLLGVSRFSIAKEMLQTHSFRLAQVTYDTLADDLNESAIHIDDRERLLKIVRTYLGANNIEADWSTIETAADYALITSLAMLCPFNAGEKQALLECDDIKKRTELLMNLMTLSLHNGEATQQDTFH